VKNFRNFFLEITPFGVKACGKSEFDIFEVKKRFPDSGKVCVLKRKVAKMRFFLKTTPFWDKNVTGNPNLTFIKFLRLQKAVY
jgi:hypothetical protein